MNALLSGPKPAFRTPGHTKTSWLGRALRPLEELPWTRPWRRGGAELQWSLAPVPFANCAPGTDILAANGQSRLSVDCTLAGDRCHDPLRYFVGMERDGSPLDRLMSVFGGLARGVYRPNLRPAESAPRG